MKKSEIQVGGKYLAKVSGSVTTVRVDAIKNRYTNSRGQLLYRQHYDVTNLKTNRKTTFRSAAKFRSAVTGSANMTTTTAQEGEYSSDPTMSSVDYPTTTTATAESVENSANATDHLQQYQSEKNQIESGDAATTQPVPTAPAAVSSTLPNTVPSAGNSSPAGATSTTTDRPAGFAAQVAAMPARRAVGSPVAGMVPNEEQEAILAAAVDNGLRVLVVAAGAGTGKTATLKMLEQVLPGNGQYTAFSSSLVAESRTKFVKAACNTTHSLAFRAVGKLYQHRLGGDRVRSSQVARILGINEFTVTLKGQGQPDTEGKPTDRQKKLSAEFLAGQVLVAVRRFCQSADRQIGAMHFRYIDGIDSPIADGVRGSDNNDLLREYLVPFARMAWDDLNRVDGQLPYQHDSYVKSWQLGTGDDRPIITADYILLDECFPAGTLLNTDKGTVTIETVSRNPGQWCVLSSVDGGKTPCYTRVVSAYKTPRNGPLVRIKHERGELVCTANHPLWVEGRGWVAAGMVACGDTLSSLRETNGAEAEMLLSSVRGAMAGAAQRPGYGGDSAGQDQQTDEGRAYRDTQPNGPTGCPCQTIRNHERARGQAPGTPGRERSRSNAARTTAVHGASATPAELAMEPRVCRLQWTAQERIPDLLQDRHSITDEADRYRGGWQLAQESQGQGEGHQKDHRTGVSRVVSVEMYQPGDRGQPRDSGCGDHQYVYTLSVETGAYYADGVLAKNCQDTAPVFLDVIKQQTHALLVLVGDSNQSIYEWRGAVNAMKSFPNAPRRLLSQSYRFGQAIADVANAVLTTLDDPTDLVMRGMPTIPSRVSTVKEPRCCLYRTNAGAVGRVMSSIAAGKRPHLIGGGADVVAWCQAAQDLQARRGTRHPELCCFDTWKEVVEYSKSDEGGDMRLMVKLVEGFGAKKIADALRNMPDEEDADIVVCTAHKSKGREWDTVKLGQDFPLANKMRDEDRRLLYVAATRAKLTLDVTSCPPFCGGEDKAWGEGGEEARWVPGLRIEYTAPMPTQEEQDTWIAEKFGNKVAGDTKTTTTAPAQPNGNGTAKDATAAGKFTWCKHGERWCARGPSGAAVGTEIEVVRKNGTSSRETVRQVVRQFDDAWVYAVN